jgi:RNA methyltransferase, TrmH family
MISKSIIKLIRSLEQKKFRTEHQLFVAEGNKIVSELIYSKQPIEHLIATRNWFEEQKTLPKINVIEVTEKELERISFQKTPQQVLAVCRIVKKELNVLDLKNSLSLALDDVQDPGNVGTIIRIADWFGIKNILASSSTADVYNPKVIQSTMGAFARVTIHYVDLTEFLKQQKNNIPIYGTTLDGENIYSQKLKPYGIIVMGSEGNGISKETLKVLTHKLFIPPFSSVEPVCDSLNVASATAIVCAEFRRQQC